jgi:hypothetical protein
MRIRFFISVLVAATACSTTQAESPGALPSSVVTIDGELPKIAVSKGGNLHVAYVKRTSNGSQVHYFGRSNDGTETVETVISDESLPVSHWKESPPAVAVADNGEIAIVYAVKINKADHLRVRRSIDQGKSWSPPESINGSEGSGYRTCISAVFNQSNELKVTFLNGLKNTVGLGFNGQQESAFPADHEILDQKTCECCGTDFVRDGLGNLFIAYRDVSSRFDRDMHLIRSVDGGKTFEANIPISIDRWKLNGCPDTGPRLTVTPANALWATWYTGNPSGIFAAVSVDQGVTFASRTPIEAISESVTSLRSPEIAPLADGRIAVVYGMTKDKQNKIVARTTTDGEQWSEPMPIAETGSYPRIATQGSDSWLALSQNQSDKKTIQLIELNSLLTNND